MAFRSKLSLALLSHELQEVRTIGPESGIGGSNAKSGVFFLFPERGEAEFPLTPALSPIMGEGDLMTCESSGVRFVVGLRKAKK